MNTENENILDPKEKPAPPPPPVNDNINLTDNTPLPEIPENTDSTRSETQNHEEK